MPRGIQREIRAIVEEELELDVLVSGRVEQGLVHEYEWQHPVRAPLLHFLATRFRLIRFDVRGVGLSDRDADGISFEGFGRDLDTVLDALDVRRPVVIGIAPGAPAAIACAVRHPERVSNSSFMAPTPSVETVGIRHNSGRWPTR